MQLIKTQLNIFRQNKYLSYFLIFEIAFILFFYLHSNLTFADPDSFYHAKMAVLMKEQGVIKSFPWQQFTVLKDYYIDHHFLYHFALIPFIIFLPPLVGVKLATICFSSLLIVMFYWLLKKLAIKGSFFYTIVLMLSNPFIFRINLAKAQALAITFLLIALYLLFKRKNIWLLVFSFVYVWLYGGWPLILVLAVILVMAEVPFLFKISFFKKRLKIKTDKLKQKIISDVKLLSSIIGGLVLGVIINPYFPKNLFFYWQQIIQIAVVNYRKVIGVGAEWYSYNPVELVASASIVFLIFIVALILFILNIKKQNQYSVFVLITTALFIGLTIKSRRNVEYLIPFMVIFSAVSLDLFFRRVNTKGFWREFKEFLLAQKLFLVLVLIPFLFVPYIVIRDVYAVKKNYRDSQSFEKFERSMSWLKNNSQPGEIVFHSDWDEFPILFYHNSQNYYIVGLDPTFMYKYNQDLYWKWERITTVKETEKAHQIIKNDFKASYVFVSHIRHERFDESLKNNFLFQEVYQDDEAKIYKVL